MAQRNLTDTQKISSDTLWGFGCLDKSNIGSFLSAMTEEARTDFIETLANEITNPYQSYDSVRSSLRALPFISIANQIKLLRGLQSGITGLPKKMGEDDRRNITKAVVEAVGSSSSINGVHSDVKPIVIELFRQMLTASALPLNGLDNTLETFTEALSENLHPTLITMLEGGLEHSDMRVSRQFAAAAVIVRRKLPVWLQPHLAVASAEAGHDYVIATALTMPRIHVLEYLRVRKLDKAETYLYPRELVSEAVNNKSENRWGWRDHRYIDRPLDRAANLGVAARLFAELAESGYRPAVRALENIHKSASDARVEIAKRQQEAQRGLSNLGTLGLYEKIVHLTK